MLARIELPDNWTDDAATPFSFREGEGWFVIYTYPQQEFRAEKGLQALGYEVFLPTERKWIRHARYKTEKIVPLLSRYLFIRLDPSKGWPGVKDVDGVCYLLCNDYVPVRVDGDIVTTLMQSCQWGVFDETTAISRLPLGAQVQILKGPLRGFVAELRKANSAEKRADIFVNMLGKTVALKLKFAELRPV